MKYVNKFNNLKTFCLSCIQCHLVQLDTIFPIERVKFVMAVVLYSILQSTLPSSLEVCVVIVVVVQQLSCYCSRLYKPQILFCLTYWHLWHTIKTHAGCCRYTSLWSDYFGKEGNYWIFISKNLWICYISIQIDLLQFLHC